MWSEDTRKAWLLPSNAYNETHGGENGSKRVGTKSFWVTTTMTYVVTGTITPFFVCMLLPFPFGTGRKRVVPCGDLRGDIRD